MDDPSLSETDDTTLRFLRILVLVLTTTMIVGIGVLVVLFATRFPGKDTAKVSAPSALTLGLPDTLDLPKGASVAAVTRAQDFWVVVTAAGEILFYAAEGGAPVRRVPPAD